MNLDNTKRLQLMENSFLIVFVLSFVCIVNVFLACLPIHGPKGHMWTRSDVDRRFWLKRKG